MAAYYNENDPFAAQWLRNLIAAGHIAPGEVDERSIVDVRPDDLRGYEQCHFFAGIGIWSHALRRAGWADDRPVWSGSCPCQPFSDAGKGDEFADERHLWPTWFRLVRQCRPIALFGEQVASKDALAWFDHVRSDLEGEGYAVGVLDTSAASVGAPHIRQRLYFVAGAGRRSVRNWRSAMGTAPRGDQGEAHKRERLRAHDRDGSIARELAHSDGGDASAEGEQRSGQQRLLAQGSRPSELADAEGIGFRQGRQDDARSGEGVGAQGAGIGPADAGGNGIVGDASSAGREVSLQQSVNGDQTLGIGSPDGDRGRGATNGPVDHSAGARRQGTREYDGRSLLLAARSLESGPTNGFWRDAIWIPCRDGKARPAKPGIFPLVDVYSGRVGILRAAGNAIVAEQAKTFIECYLDTMP